MKKALLGLALAALVAAPVAGIAFAKDDDEKKGKGAPKVELHINHEGKAYVAGATVTGMSSSSINIALKVGSVTLNGVILTDGSTELIGRGEGRIALSDIKVGDTVSARGMAVSSNGMNVLQASIVKDWSFEKKAPVARTIQGTVKSIVASGASSTLPAVVTVTQGSKEIAVKVSAATSLLTKAWLRLSSFAEVKVGDTVRAYGLLENEVNLDATVLRLLK